MNDSRLSSKERMLVVLRNGVPDRVPVTPDISNTAINAAGIPLRRIFAGSWRSGKNTGVMKLHI